MINVRNRRKNLTQSGFPQTPVLNSILTHGLQVVGSNRFKAAYCILPISLSIAFFSQIFDNPVKSSPLPPPGPTAPDPRGTVVSPLLGVLAAGSGRTGPERGLDPLFHGDHRGKLFFLCLWVFIFVWKGLEKNFGVLRRKLIVEPAPRTHGSTWHFCWHQTDDFGRFLSLTWLWVTERNTGRWL